MTAAHAQARPASPGAMIQQQKRRIRQRGLLTLKYCALIVLALLFLFPIAWSLLHSLKKPSEALAVPPTYLPTEIVFEIMRS